MATDKRIVQGLFAGDRVAFYRFHKENQELFKLYFHKHFPSNKSVDISEVYQESFIVLWNQISEGKLTESSLTVDIFSYLVSIGRNKYFEELRKYEKFSRLKKGERVFKKRKETFDNNENETPDGGKFILQNKKQQIELDKRIDDFRPVQIGISEESDESDLDRRIEKQKFIEDQVRNMEEPCKSVIRDTWWNNMTDEEIMEANQGLFPSTDAVKTRRYRCHQKLKALIKDWFVQLNN